MAADSDSSHLFVLHISPVHFSGRLSLDGPWATGFVPSAGESAIPELPQRALCEVGRGNTTRDPCNLARAFELCTTHGQHVVCCLVSCVGFGIDGHWLDDLLDECLFVGSLNSTTEAWERLLFIAFSSFWFSHKPHSQESAIQVILPNSKKSVHLVRWC